MKYNTVLQWRYTFHGFNDTLHTGSANLKLSQKRFVFKIPTLVVKPYKAVKCVLMSVNLLDLENGLSILLPNDTTFVGNDKKEL